MRRGVTIVDIKIDTPDVAAVVLEQPEVQVMHRIDNSVLDGVPVWEATELGPTYPVHVKESFMLDDGGSVMPVLSSPPVFCEVSLRPACMHNVLHLVKREIAEGTEEAGCV